MGYTITRIAWHTPQAREAEPYEAMAAEFWVLVDFLQRNGLTTRQLAASVDDLHEDFGIHTDDVTPEGLVIMKSPYTAWQRKIERGMSPEDTSILERALERIRQGA